MPDKKKVNDVAPGYRIEGNVSNFSEGTKFYLYDLATNANVDSATVKDNRFFMEGHIADPPSLFWLRATDGEDYVYTPLFIGNDNLTLIADKKDFAWNVKTSGSLIDANYRKSLEVTKELDIKRDSLIFVYHALSDVEKEESSEEFMKAIGKIDSIIKLRTIEFIKETSDTYAGMLQLSFHKDDIPKDSVKIIFDRYSNELKQSKFGRVVKIYLQSNNIEKGEKYLDFVGLNQFNNKTSLSDIMEERKFLLINYTSAYCGFCIKATDELREIYNNYQNSLNIVDFSADPKKEDWLKSVERDQNSWISLWDGNGMYSESALRYNFSVTPTFLLISPEGKIVDRWVGYKKGKLKKDLEKYF
jgi:peroxiredoxin